MTTRKSPELIARELVQKLWECNDETFDHPAYKVKAKHQMDIIAQAIANERALPKLSVWGSNSCNGCEGGRITLYYESDGLCVSCRNIKAERPE